ncbi:MAG: HD-GYP domain-containing protein [Clostridiaceae bacterium]|nr:HD-GYP domain-containing protein [Clostridiaceae bacterium]
MDPVEDSGNILDRLKNTYIYLIGFSIIPLILATTLRVDFSRYPYILFWLILEILAEVKPFKSTFYLKMDMTLSFASQMAMVILLDTWEAIWIVIVATIIAGTILRRRRDKVLFYAGQYGLCLLVSSLVFHSLKLSPPGTNLHIIKDLHAVLASVCVYYVLNTFFISVVTSVFSRDRFLDVFFNDLKIMANFYFSVTSISVAASLLYDEQAPYNILILVLPLIMTDQALQRYYSLHKETVETLNVLADIIDERDKNTYLHSLRVAEYSEKIAQELRLSSGAIDEIGTASRVHDIGKIILEDSILKNPGKLQDYEYAKIKQHPVIAHRLLKNLKPYQKGASYVLYHHERMDGNGYPSNLHGRSIPIGARIIAVADCYDAMTSDRPYRKALPQRVAVEELRKNSGNQFDPLIVEAFIKVLKRDYGYKENSMGQ